MKEYIIQNYPEFKSELCFWVTGHSMGGGVANLLASKLIDGYGNLGGNRDNVYCYTFAAPNTFYRTDNIDVENSTAKEGEQFIIKYREPKSTKYRCIFNIVNDDDFVPKLPMEECEWTKYGRVAKKSVTELKNNISEVDSGYKKYLKNKYSTNLNSIKKIVESFNNMYQDKKNMRYESYQYAKTNGKMDYAKFRNQERYKKGLAFYAKPYQKNVTNTDGSILQYQMPAYVMQSITNAIHDKVSDFEKDESGNIKLDDNGRPIIKIREQEPKPFMSENQRTFKAAVLANDRLQSSAFEILVGEGIFKAIDYPHYTESYYSLTKEISTKDFR